MEKYKVKPDTIARTICLVLTLANQILAWAGKGQIPFVEDDIYQLVSLVATIGVGIWTWWKNNSFTQSALAGDALMKTLKSGDALNDTEE